ncbi:MAG: triosephosphate isomerase [Nanoarchaeota archaeon]|nr:triosephosphate isomerase [Nanoarchaeota archaeon]
MYNSKIRAVLQKEGTQITYCIGETLDEREDGRTFKILEEQLKIGLNGVSKEDYGRLIIAYEPRWAIGGDKEPPTDEEIYAAHSKIEDMVGKSVPIVYGGSVNPENIAKIISIDKVNGVLVGGASLDAEKFASIVLFDKK